jgi:hypothetical protein
LLGNIFAKNKEYMETVKKSRTKYWILFFLSIAAFFGVYAVGGGYCSLVLPFVVTYFAQAMDLL